MTAIVGRPGPYLGRLFVIGILALGLLACRASPTPPAPPSEAAGRALLGQLIDRAAGGSLATLCDLGSGTCPHDLRSVDPATVPKEAPRIIGTRVVTPVQTDNGDWTQGGRLFELCGRDGTGASYESQVLIFDAGGRLLAVNAVFWTGAKIAEVDVTESTLSPSPDC